MTSNYDLLIVGGGAAGLMSATIVQNKGLRVGLLERNARIGKSFLLRETGVAIIQIYTLHSRTFPVKASALRRLHLKHFRLKLFSPISAPWELSRRLKQTEKPFRQVNRQ